MDLPIAWIYPLDVPLPHEDLQTACALQARQLVCQRGERLLFAGLDLDLKPGSALILTGPNGAGKTSLLRILAGLLRPSSGMILALPRVNDRHLAQFSRFIGVRDALKQNLTPRETLQFQMNMASLADLSARQKTTALHEALAQFRLLPMADLPNGWLSSGQRRRVSLAGLALCGMGRPLWLLDEPANALDAQACQQLAAAVATHRQHGGMVVAATHQALGWPDVVELRLGAEYGNNADAGRGP